MVEQSLSCFATYDLRVVPIYSQNLVSQSRSLAFAKSNAFCSLSSIPLNRPLFSSNRSHIQTTTPPFASSSEMNSKKVELFESEEELALSLAKYTADLSNKFVQERGVFTVVVSGGSLFNFLGKLTNPPFLDSIEWAKWHIFWVDERVVPKDHKDSNYKLALDKFLSKVPIPPGHVYSINDTLTAQGAAEDYETCLKHLVHNGIISKSSATGFPKFDLILLGMGPDGHVASLFPGHDLLEENHKWVASITDSPKPPPERITFTFPVINSSSYIALVVCGSNKSDVVEKALGNSETPELLPVQMVSPEEELKWFLDKEAASKLKGM